MGFEDILVDTCDGVATITINRPHARNAVRPQTYEELTAALGSVGDDPTIGVVVMTGAGEKAFCSGGDVKDQQKRHPTIARGHNRRLIGLSNVMRMIDKPIIAKIRGYCVGGGNEINLFCDLAVASENAMFGQVGPRVGSVPIWGAAQLLARYVGERKAREMIYTCRMYSAQDARDMGLINEVWPDNELDEKVDVMCQEILDKSPQSIRIAKIALNAGTDQEFYSSFFPTAELLAASVGNEENMEGVNAFLEKRPVEYRRFRRAPE